MLKKLIIITSIFGSSNFLSASGVGDLICKAISKSMKENMRFCVSKTKGYPACKTCCQQRYMQTKLIGGKITGSSESQCLYFACKQLCKLGNL